MQMNLLILLIFLLYDICYFSQLSNNIETFRQDPCPGEDKFADIRYRCVAASTPGIKTKTVGGACAFNPCKHGGLCYLTEESFKCDCSSIEYTGDTCNTKESKSIQTILCVLAKAGLNKSCAFLSTMF